MQDPDVSKRMTKWLMGSDTGVSSKAILAFMVLVPNGTVYADTYPYDPADLGRCLRLLDLIPEWKPHVAGMASNCGPYWKALVERWDELSVSLAAEVGEGWPKGSAPKTYALMRSILDPIEDADPCVVRLGKNMKMRTGPPHV